MIAIVNVDQNWAIGYRGELLCRISADLKRFKRLTWGKVVIYGRKTLLTFPKGQTLPGRINVILSGQPDFQVQDGLIAHDLNELDRILFDLKGQGFIDDDFILIGGSSLYDQLFDRLDKVYVTKVDQSFPADSYFPNLDKLENWSVVTQSDKQLDGDLAYSYWDYEKQDKC